ncbi:Hypothetical predicted protein [Mytilus galloprovincialis]|nr:Hypothetical predicted protein [Mytilus galloprovincialis]
MNMVLRALMNKRAVNVKTENHFPPTPPPTTMPPSPPPTTMPPMPPPTTMPMITLPPGCVYRGQTYRFGEMIEQGQSGNWCYFTMCDHSGQIIYGDDFHCSTTLPPITTLPSTPTPRGCFFEGKHYQLGEQISSGHSGNWCYFAMCDHSGQIIHGDDFNCLTTLPPTPTPRGCFFEGKHYQLGEQISSGHSGNWCYFSMCDHSGQIIHGDDFNCLTTLPPNPTPRGCFFEGKHYQLGEQISSGHSGNWCYFSMCDHSGQIIHGDDFNCLTTLRPTTPTPPIIHIG